MGESTAMLRQALLTAGLVFSSAAGALDANQMASRQLASLDTTTIRVERSLMVERFDHSSGKPILVEAPPANLWPGAELVYRVTYVNTDIKPQRVMVTNPLPASVVYLSGEAEQIPADALVSVDGGVSFGNLPALRVRATPTYWYPAAKRDVTHVRFVTRRPVNPGESGQFSVRLRLK